jgi:hypothetical protein
MAFLLTSCRTSPTPVGPAPGRVVIKDATERQNGPEAAGPLGARTGAYLTLSDAAGRVDVRFADLPGLLYRITTPYESGLAPRVEGPAGHPRVRLRPTGGDGPETVTILLNRTVRWDIRLPGGGEQVLDLRAGRPARVRLGGGGLVDLRLPAPDGRVPVTVSGSVGDLTLTAPARTALRLRLRGGAARAAVPWAAERAAAPGTELAGPGWAGAHDRYTVDVDGTVGVLTVR